MGSNVVDSNFEGWVDFYQVLHIETVSKMYLSWGNKYWENTSTDNNR